MDIAGPLSKSKRYVLVLCNHHTQYPEAVALHSTNAKHVAKEIVQSFSQVEVPEILTDQGPNFVSVFGRTLENQTHPH